MLYGITGRRGAMAFALLAMLGACSSIEDVRSSEPIVSETLAGTPSSIVSCVAEEMLTRRGVNHWVAADGSEGRVVSNLAEGAVRTVLWEAHFTVIDETSTLYEMRAMRTVWGNPVSDADTGSKIILDCAG